MWIHVVLFTSIPFIIIIIIIQLYNLMFDLSVMTRDILRIAKN